MHTTIELFEFTRFHFLDYYRPCAVMRLKYFSRILKTPYTSPDTEAALKFNLSCISFSNIHNPIP